jgi:hypothetical protein
MHRGSSRPFSVAALLVFLGSALLLLFSQCFAPEYHDCAYRCDPKAPACPDEYECQKDGYCHLRGTSALCPIFVLDLGAPDH